MLRITNLSQQEDYVMNFVILFRAFCDEVRWFRDDVHTESQQHARANELDFHQCTEFTFTWINTDAGWLDEKCVAKFMNKIFF